MPRSCSTNQHCNYWPTNNYCHKVLEGWAGLEPACRRLTVYCVTVTLPTHVVYLLQVVIYKTTGIYHVVIVQCAGRPLPYKTTVNLKDPLTAEQTRGALYRTRTRKNSLENCYVTITSIVHVVYVGMGTAIGYPVPLLSHYHIYSQFQICKVPYT